MGEMNRYTMTSCGSLNLQLKRAKPYLGVIFLQFGYAGQNILAKTALNQGMNHFIFSVYRNAIAALLFAPFAILLERKVRPRMTTSIFLKIFLLGLLEPVIDQNLYYAGMKYTTATFAVTMCNVIPALIFIMAWILRLEKVNMKSLHSQGKILGTIATVGGAMVMSIIKGPIIGLPWTNSTNLHQSSASHSSRPQDSLKGSLMITVGCFCWAAFIILQAITLKSYPVDLSLTALICGIGALQGAVLTLAVEKGNFAIWSIHWDTSFFSALYSGIICSGIGYYISGVIMQERGPVFVTAFSPLAMVIVAFLSSLIFAEQLVLGSIIGAVLIVTGLYLVIWGKSHDQTVQVSSKLENGDEQIGAIDGKITTKNDDVSIPGRKVGDESV